jgi:hypothetical protein
MKEYLSNLSAAIAWDIPYIDAVLGYKISESDAPHITVTKPNARLRNNGKKVHSCELALPAGAIVSRNGRMVASPELMFMELACKLSIHRLILLGLQLCSHPPGLPFLAITTKQKLNTFLSKTAGHRGHRKSIQAVKYLENGSASIMESIAFMILTLPHSLGGYGLRGAVFNYEISLNSEARMRLGQNRCFTDIYYRHAKLAVEYESFAFHNSPLEQGKDLIRSAVLERQGIGLMRLSTIQLYNTEACRDFAYNLAARLKTRIRIYSKKFDEMHSLLRDLLPDGKPVFEPTSKPTTIPEITLK